jgi:1-acyl-sn-glycerol-3-phosphate acyltransferase
LGLTKFIFHRLLGWKIDGDFDRNILKAVVIVVPHTSWHDFYIGVFARRILKTEINFVAKKELFKWPFGAYFRWMGGTPLDRSGGLNKVDAIAKIFSEKKEFRMAMAPEGTRKKVDRWKTGFYYIALNAKVPIIPVSFDYKTKTVKIGKAFFPTGNIEPDLEILRQFYQGVVGKIPENT